MENLNRIRFLTENYNELQGLKHIPVGIVILLIAFTPLLMNDVNLSIWVYFAIVGLLLVGTTFANQRITAHYAETYGVVGASNQCSEDIAWSVVGIGLFVLEIALGIPIGLTMLVLALYYIIKWHRSAGLCPHYLPIAGVFLLSSLAPLLTDDPFTVYLVITGVILIIIGWLDHRVLVSTLNPPDEVS